MRRMNRWWQAAWLTACVFCRVEWALAADEPCPNCAAWNIPQQPFRIYGNTYYVGTHGLSSVLITSSSGHVLIDGGLPESAAQIAANVRQLGFRVEDVKVLLNSHVHFDHAGGLAELQRSSGAKVFASRSSAAVLRTGNASRDDPQYGLARPIAKLAKVGVVKDGDVVRAGPLKIRAHMTPGHTSGGTSWSWQSCEQDNCLNMVYADSLTAVSADEFMYTNSRAYPHALSDFDKSFATLAALACDVLLTPHPELSGLWEKLEQREKVTTPNPLIDPNACKVYADAARAGLARRVARETTSQ